ncbi:hypothetical protein BJV78DRAFT_1154551 [Lactifluus subvellereus]|nr:hypothetical protein BJV78DRAFT_1154551 [Lactifluus subvellereus]
MLALSRSTRAVCRFSHHVRALSTVAPSASSPNTTGAKPSGTANSTTHRRRNRLANSSAECMFVYPWNGIRSSAEGLAIARAVQDKYGPAKEVVFPRGGLLIPSKTQQDPDSITVFHSYFWLVFDGPDVRKRLPEESAQIRVRVADLPRDDGDVGVEEMMRALGSSITHTDTDAPHEPQPPSATEEGTSTDASKADDGYKTLDVRVEWARAGPSEVFLRRRPASASLPNKEALPDFAATWLAFDGFSPESARGPHTPNLLRAREKWRNLAPKALSAHGDDITSPPLFGGEEEELQSPVGGGAESASGTAKAAAKADADADADAGVRPPPREWVPIIPSSLRAPPATHRTTASAPQTRPAAAAPSDHHAPSARSVAAAAAGTTATDTAAAPTPTGGSAEVPPSPSPKLTMTTSRRERILHLARQNARTPLPERLLEDPRARTGDEQKPEEEGEIEQQGKERTIRERLWRLVGGNY